MDVEAAKLSELPRYPAVGGTCLIALAIYAAAPPEFLAPLQLDLRAFWAEPWRLLTSALVHGGQLQGDNWLLGLGHVGFNCYWLWVLGTQVERRLGHLATLGLFALFALAGSALEYAMTGPAVGLSGVVYGLVGMLAVLGRRSPRWRAILDKRTLQFFGFWFVLCIAMTLTGAMSIANFAHAGGAGVGALVGWALVVRGRRRGLAVAAIIAALGLSLAGATVLRPWVNLSTRAGLDAMVLAERAERADDIDAAVSWAERGVGYWRTPADHWAYLGRLYFQQGELDAARAALDEALAREPDNEIYAAAREQLEAMASASEH